jgi:membrane protease YdiL (CAAX protease family)
METVPTSSPPRPFPGVLQAIWLVLLIWLGGLVPAAVVGIVTIALTGQVFDTSDPKLLILFNVCGFSVAILLGAKLTGAGARRVFPLSRFPAGILPPLALVCLCGMVVVSEIDTLFRMLPLPEWLRMFMELVDRTILDMMRKDFPMAVVATVVMAPLTEELFFRGLLLFGFLPRYGVPRGIFLSALIFAVAHFTPNQLTTALLAGILLGWLFARTGSLWPPILAHAFVNGLSVIATRISLSRGEEITDPPTLLPWWVTTAAVLVLVGSLRWLSGRLGPASALLQAHHT